MQDAYIDMLKYYQGIDLTNARDTNFDTRKYFNIDTRALNQSQMATFRSVAANVPFFDISFSANGPYRLAIFVTHKK